jgi:hypothetical protein
MGWFKNISRRRSAGTAIPVSGSPVCDSCNAELRLAEAYLLSTNNVVVSISYWQERFAVEKRVQDMFNMDGRQRLAMFDDGVRVTAAQATPWAICESCSEFFIFDRDEARSCALRAAAPAGSGRVDPAGFVLFAAEAWEQVHGQWPANVPRPDVTDSCDLCTRNIHNGDISIIIPRDRMEHFRANGLVEDDPVSGSRPGEDGWTACHSCTARLFARAHRAQHSQ